MNSTGFQPAEAAVTHAANGGSAPAAGGEPPAFARWLSMTNSVTKQFLAGAGDAATINLGGGLPAPDLYPVAAMAKSLGRVMQRFGGDALAYGPVEGLPELREAIAARMGMRRRFSVENILVTTGAMQALDLIGKIFIDPGDAIVAQHPTYLGALDAWRPRSPAYRRLDWSLAGEAAARAAAGARFVYAVPNFSNPTGELVDAGRRAALVASTAAANTPLVEDDPYAGLLYEGQPLPRMIDFAGRTGDVYDGHVIYLGTLSKCLAPGLRIGWIAAAPPVIEALILAKQGADLTTSALAQAAAVEMIRDNVEGDYLPLAIAEYRRRRDALCAAAQYHLGEHFTWETPPGGMFLWAKARSAAIDTDRLHAQAAARGVIYAPSSAFDFAGADKSAMRLNFTFNPPEKLREGARRLGEAVEADLA